MSKLTTEDRLRYFDQQYGHLVTLALRSLEEEQRKAAQSTLEAASKDQIEMGSRQAGVFTEAADRYGAAAEAWDKLVAGVDPE